VKKKFSLLLVKEMSFAAPASYPLGVAQSDIPAAWMPSSEPRVASGGSQRIVAVSSQNGTVTSGQQLSFQLPANLGSGFMKSGSAYIRCTVSVTQANAYSWAFRQYGSAESMFMRCTALLSGSVAEQIQNYNKLMASLKLHATNVNYVVSDDQILQNTMSSAFNTAQTLQVCIPVNLGLFNAKCHLPLFLLSACQLQVDLDSAVQSFTSGTADAITEYSISQAQLVFEQLVPDSVYEQGVKQMLASRVYQVPIQTWYNLKLANAAAITQNIGLNSSSVKGIFWNVVIGNTARNTGAFTSATQSSAYLYLDGQLVSNSNLATAPEQFAEMNRALNVLTDISRTSWGPSTAAGVSGNAVAGDLTASLLSRTVYSSGAYLGGLSCSRSDQAGFSFSGTPVNTAVLQVANAGTAGDFYIYCALQQVLTIDLASNVNLIR
jgi:hypothetical protein